MCFNLLVPECTTILLSLFSTAVAIVLSHVFVCWTEEPALVRNSTIITHVVDVVVAYLRDWNNMDTILYIFSKIAYMYLTS